MFTEISWFELLVRRSVEKLCNVVLKSAQAEKMTYGQGQSTDGVKNDV